MEISHFGLASDIPNPIVAKLPVNAINDKLCTALKSTCNVTHFSTFYGICCLTATAKNLF